MGIIPTAGTLSMFCQWQTMKRVSAVVTTVKRPQAIEAAVGVVLTPEKFPLPTCTREMEALARRAATVQLPLLPAKPVETWGQVSQNVPVPRTMSRASSLWKTVAKNSRCRRLRRPFRRSQAHLLESFHRTTLPGAVGLRFTGAAALVASYIAWSRIRVGPTEMRLTTRARL